MYNIKCDVHTHLLSLFGEVSLDEIAKAADMAGIELIADTKGFSSLVVSSDEDMGVHDLFKENDDVKIAESKVNILQGCDVNIASPEGYLFGIGLPVCKEKREDAFNNLRGIVKAANMPDFLVAQASNRLGLYGINSMDATKMFIKVAEDPRILMLSYLGRCNINFEVNELLNRLRELGKPIAISEKSLTISDDITNRVRKIMEKCAQLSVMVCICSEAQSIDGIGNFEEVKKLLLEIDFPGDLIMNRDAETFLAKYKAAGF
ncbi:MAG: hypothetical protein E7301_09700 [Butyrivibrio sp.]|nr:hypothetical protein [Butyrivibrio sp.]